MRSIVAGRRADTRNAHTAVATVTPLAGPGGVEQDGRVDDQGTVNLDNLAGELLGDAAMQSALRSAHTLPHPVDGLRQTVIALVAGQELAEHESPGPASLMVLRGSVRLVAGDESQTVGALEISPIPNRRHSLHADEDSVVLLSVAVPQRAPGAH
jgi:quercetin dioxygenase-like cupin family protein